MGVNAGSVPLIRHDTLARLMQNGQRRAIPPSCKGRSMIMLPPQADVFEETVPCRADVCLPLILTGSDGVPVRFVFAHDHRS